MMARMMVSRLSVNRRTWRLASSHELMLGALALGALNRTANSVRHGEIKIVSRNTRHIDSIFSVTRIYHLCTRLLEGVCIELRKAWIAGYIAWKTSWKTDLNHTWCHMNSVSLCGIKFPRLFQKYFGNSHLYTEISLNKSRNTSNYMCDLDTFSKIRLHIAS